MINVNLNYVERELDIERCQCYIITQKNLIPGPN